MSTNGVIEFSVRLSSAQTDGVVALGCMLGLAVVVACVLKFGSSGGDK